MTNRLRYKRPVDARRALDFTSQSAPADAVFDVTAGENSSAKVLVGCALCGARERVLRTLFDGKHWIAICETCDGPLPLRRNRVQ